MFDSIIGKDIYFLLKLCLLSVVCFNFSYYIASFSIINRMLEKYYIKSSPKLSALFVVFCKQHY